MIRICSDTDIGMNRSSSDWLEIYFNPILRQGSSCAQFDPVFTCLWPKYIIFSFKNLENGRQDKNGRGWTIFCFNGEKKFSDILFSLPLLKFGKKSFMYFRHKYVETWNQKNLLISDVSHALNFHLLSVDYSDTCIWKFWNLEQE